MVVVDRIKNVIKRFKDSNLHSETAREVIAISIYEELLDELNKKDERGL